MNAIEFMNVFCEREYRVHHLYAIWAKANGINYNILAVLYPTYKKEGCTQKFICKEWGLPKQTVNSICKDLIAKGIIIQKQSATDKREMNLNLTEKGLTFAKPIVTELLKIENDVLAYMGEDKVKLFLELYYEYAKCMKNEFTKSIQSLCKRSK